MGNNHIKMMVWPKTRLSRLQPGQACCFSMSWPVFSQACCFSMSWQVQCLAAAPVGYKIQQFSSTLAIVQQGITGIIDSCASLAKSLLEFARLCPGQEPARCHCLCWRRPNQLMLMTPAQALREALSMHQSPNVKTEAVEDLGAQSQKFPPNVNQSPNCSSRPKTQA